MTSQIGRTNGTDATAPSPQGQKLADALGWASLGLGVPQTIAPGAFDRLIGVKPEPKPRIITVTACGLRELAAAAGILAFERPRPARWLWARVAGDALDLTLLLRALRNRSESRPRTAAAIGAVAGISAADVYAATRMSAASAEDASNVRAAITVRRPAEEVYSFWRNFQNLPGFMFHVENVEARGDGRWHWAVKAPGGTVEWDAEVVEDRPNELISWRSLAGARIDNSGSVRFREAPRDQGTEIHVELRYDAPGAAVGAVLAKLLGKEPRQQVKDDLRRFKQVMETGEVVRSEGTPEGQAAPRHLKQRPAMPLEGSPS
jgi:uncharacterized membrane protein